MRPRELKPVKKKKHGSDPRRSEAECAAECGADQWRRELSAIAGVLGKSRNHAAQVQKSDFLGCKFRAIPPPPDWSLRASRRLVNLGKKFFCSTCDGKHIYQKTLAVQYLSKPCWGTFRKTKAANKRLADIANQQRTQLKQEVFQAVFMGRTVGSSSAGVSREVPPIQQRALPQSVPPFSAAARTLAGCGHNRQQA